MLTDRAHLEVRAGAGGNGSLSFRREAHVPKGGPDGGDGGRGGDVILRCDDSMRDLQSFRRRAHFRAERGGHGLGKQMHGADGDALIVAVPPGTQVERWDGTRYDLVRPGQQVTIARGGAGGRGNTRFKGPTRQTPRLAEKGLPGEEGRIELHLKLLADVGLVGLPNAGKSSLLARLTRAQPKVAAYPFTTLEPVLGTLDADDRQLVIADIPGLIEGASAGAGLGHDFLAHVERTRLLVHVLDLAPLDGSDPAANHAVIEAELRRARRPPRRAAAHPRAVEGRPRTAGDRRSGDRRMGASGSASRSSSRPRRPARGSTSCGASCCVASRSAEPVPEDAGEDDVAEFQVFRPAAGRAFEVERTGDARVPRHRRRRRPPDRAPRPRQRGGARARRAPPPPHGRDHRARGERVRAGRRRRARRRGVRARPLLRFAAPCPSPSSSWARRSSPRNRASCACPWSRGSARRSPRCTARASTSSSSPAARSRAGCTCSSMGARPAAVEELQAASAVGQGRLYRTYDELLRERGIQTAQVLLTFFDMSARTHYLNARRTLQKLLEWRIVPVINENDTTTTDEISFGDNDFLAAQVAVLAGRRPARAADRHRRASTPPTRAIDRRRAARRARSPTPRSSATLEIGHAPSPLGSGGMRSKVVAAEMATAAGIADRDRQRAAARRARARVGRGAGRHPLRVRRRCASRASSCGSSTPSRRTGRVTVDAGAARALREGGTSLLPVGIVDVRGRVRRRRRGRRGRDGGAAIGKGICNYSAAELRQVMGMKSAEVRERAAARDRGGRPPRLLRARLSPRLSAMAIAAAHPSPRSAWPPSAPRARSPRLDSRDQGRARCWRWPTRSGGARRRDPRGQRARPRGGPRVRALARR